MRVYRYIFSFFLLVVINLCCQPGLKAEEPVDSVIVISDIVAVGNNITKDKIIFRELSFAVGDTLTPASLKRNLQRSRENLQNTSLFNFVQILTEREGDYTLVRIVVTERWYIWPLLLFEHADRNLPAWIREPDFNRLNYGLQLNWNNFRGRKELLEFKARFGYKEQFAVNYFKPNLDRAQKHGMSFGINKFRQHEITFRTIGNEPAYLSSDSNYIYEAFSTAVSYYHRPGLYFSQELFLNYASTVFRNDEFVEEYLGTSNDDLTRYLTLGYSAKYDIRDSWVYPLEGYLLNFRLLHRGLGMFKDFDYPKTYLTFIGAYHKPLLKRLYWGTAAKIRLTKDELLPYHFREGLGFNSYLRGFEYYLIDGNSYFLSVNNLKYAIIPRINHHIKWIPWEQFNKVHFSFYGGLFFDVAYVDADFYREAENDLANQLLFSGGLGFDFVSYYDQVLRLEFTLNSLGEPGVYLHVEMPFTRW